ncbi:hypothetical protein QPK87_13560 [Kamptonema cortianum]|nr:hypothetical protein [Kamptonema cortianum]
MSLPAMQNQEPLFSESEVRSVQTYWSHPGRYEEKAPDYARETGPYQARQTTDGSLWLWEYNRLLRGDQKLNPIASPKPETARQQVWETWIEARYARDEWLAALEAIKKNEGALNKSFPIDHLKDPGDPGDIPADLLALAGHPPKFVTVVAPRQHVVNFDDMSLSFADNTKVRRKYAYYRFESGIMDGGQPMRGKTIDELRPLFSRAGVKENELRVMAAVSLLEGGFDSINTYDTGYVSVGFIQFASLKGGAGSLGQVLLRMKRDKPREFEQNFRRFGLDVTADGQLACLDLESGELRVGPEANDVLIKDKRLTATFVRAGRLSQEFKVAQIQIAKELYYPADDPIVVKVGNKEYRGKVKDIFKTEAGIATLMDRKVNTGKFGDLVERVAEMMTTYGFQSLGEVSKAEHQLIRALTFRKNYLEAANLSKPREIALVPSRGGNRGGTSGKSGSGKTGG